MEQNNNGMAMLNSAYNKVEQTARLYESMIALQHPEDYVAAQLKNMQLSGSNNVIYNGEPLFYHEFLNRFWLDYTRAVMDHNRGCMALKAKDGMVKRFSREDIGIAISEWKRLQLVEERKRIARELSYDGVGGTAVAEQWLSITTGEVKRGDLGALLHSIWQVKRKMIGQRTGWEHMLVIYGGDHGSGKSTALEMLLQPIDTFVMPSTLRDLTDGRFHEMLSVNLVLVINEMSGAEKADVELLKTLITEPTISFRPMRTTEVVRIPQMTTLFGTSNKEVAEQIHDEQMRRFYQLNCADKIDKDALRKLDMLALWKSVDESRQWGYYDEYRTDMAQNRAMIEESNPFATWMKEVNLKPAAAGTGKCTTVNKLYDQYRTWMQDNGYNYCPNCNKFGAMLTRAKFPKSRHRLGDFGGRAPIFYHYSADCALPVDDYTVLLNHNNNSNERPLF